MFASILQFFQGAWNWFDWLWREFWRQFVFAATSIWGVIVIWAGLWYTLITHITGWMQEIITWFGSIVLPTVNIGVALQTVSSVLATANTFLPVEEGFVILTAYLAFQFALQIIGVIHYIKKMVWAG